MTDAIEKQKALDFLISAGIIRLNERTLEGAEKEQMMLILALLTPTHSTNNQRFITEHYQHGELKYSVTYFDEKEYDIIEIKPL